MSLTSRIRRSSSRATPLPLSLTKCFGPFHENIKDNDIQISSSRETETKADDPICQTSNSSTAAAVLSHALVMASGETKEGRDVQEEEQQQNPARLDGPVADGDADSEQNVEEAAGKTTSSGQQRQDDGHVQPPETALKFNENTRQHLASPMGSCRPSPAESAVNLASAQRTLHLATYLEGSEQQGHALLSTCLNGACRALIDVQAIVYDAWKAAQMAVEGQVKVLERTKAMERSHAFAPILDTMEDHSKAIMDQNIQAERAIRALVRVGRNYSASFAQAFKNVKKKETETLKVELALKQTKALMNHLKDECTRLQFDMSRVKSVSQDYELKGRLKSGRHELYRQAERYGSLSKRYKAKFAEFCDVAEQFLCHNDRQMIGLAAGLLNAQETHHRDAAARHASAAVALNNQSPEALLVEYIRSHLEANEETGNAPLLTDSDWASLDPLVEENNRVSYGFYSAWEPSFQSERFSFRRHSTTAGTVRADYSSSPITLTSLHGSQQQSRASSPVSQEKRSLDVQQLVSQPIPAVGKADRALSSGGEFLKEGKPLEPESKEESNAGKELLSPSVSLGRASQLSSVEKIFGTDPNPRMKSSEHTSGQEPSKLTIAGKIGFTKKQLGSSRGGSQVMTRFKLTAETMPVAEGSSPVISTSSKVDSNRSNTSPEGSMEEASNQNEIPARGESEGECGDNAAAASATRTRSGEALPINWRKNETDLEAAGESFPPDGKMKARRASSPLFLQTELLRSKMLLEEAVRSRRSSPVYKNQHKSADRDLRGFKYTPCASPSHFPKNEFHRALQYGIYTPLRKRRSRSSTFADQKISSSRQNSRTHGSNMSSRRQSQVNVRNHKSFREHSTIRTHSAVSFEEPDPRGLQEIPYPSSFQRSRRCHSSVHTRYPPLRLGRRPVLPRDNPNSRSPSPGLFFPSRHTSTITCPSSCESLKSHQHMKASFEKSWQHQYELDTHPNYVPGIESCRTEPFQCLRNEKTWKMNGSSCADIKDESAQVNFPNGEDKASGDKDRETKNLLSDETLPGTTLRTIIREELGNILDQLKYRSSKDSSSTGHKSNRRRHVRVSICAENILEACLDVNSYKEAQDAGKNEAPEVNVPTDEMAADGEADAGEENDPWHVSGNAKKLLITGNLQEDSQGHHKSIRVVSAPLAPTMDPLPSEDEDDETLIVEKLSIEDPDIPEDNEEDMCSSDDKTMKSNGMEDQFQTNKSLRHVIKEELRGLLDAIRQQVTSRFASAAADVQEDLVGEILEEECCLGDEDLLDNETSHDSLQRSLPMRPPRARDSIPREQSKAQKLLEELEYSYREHDCQENELKGRPVAGPRHKSLLEEAVIEESVFTSSQETMHQMTDADIFSKKKRPRSTVVTLPHHGGLQASQAGIIKNHQQARIWDDDKSSAVSLSAGDSNAADDEGPAFNVTTFKVALPSTSSTKTFATEASLGWMEQDAMTFKSVRFSEAQKTVMSTDEDYSTASDLTAAHASGDSSTAIISQKLLLDKGPPWKMQIRSAPPLIDANDQIPVIISIDEVFTARSEQGHNDSPSFGMECHGSILLSMSPELADLFQEECDNPEAILKLALTPMSGYFDRSLAKLTGASIQVAQGIVENLTIGKRHKECDLDVTRFGKTTQNLSPAMSLMFSLNMEAVGEYLSALSTFDDASKRLTTLKVAKYKLTQDSLQNWLPITVSNQWERVGNRAIKVVISVKKCLEKLIHCPQQSFPCKLSMVFSGRILAIEDEEVSTGISRGQLDKNRSKSITWNLDRLKDKEATITASISTASSAVWPEFCEVDFHWPDASVAGIDVSILNPAYSIWEKLYSVRSHVYAFHSEPEATQRVAP